jgi:hypothetical protein
VHVKRGCCSLDWFVPSRIGLAERWFWSVGGYVGVGSRAEVGRISSLPISLRIRGSEFKGDSRSSRRGRDGRVV